MTAKQKRKRIGSEATLAGGQVKRGIARSNELAKTAKQIYETKTKGSRKCKMELRDEIEKDVSVEELLNGAQMNFSHDGHSVGIGDEGASSSTMGFLNLPGFRFSPKDDELVGYWLRAKCEGVMIYDVISAVDLYAHEPWELPDMCKLGGDDVEWYFFTYRGAVTNRGTKAGYWKATGRDREILVCGRRMGMKKTLVFYEGRAPNGTRTDWVMHEYRMEEAASGRDSGWVVCRVMDKTGLPAQRNARQRGMGGSRVDEAFHLLHASQPLPPAVAPMVGQAIDNIIGQTHRSHEEEEEQAQPPLPSPPTFYEHVPDEDGDDAKFVYQAFHVREDPVVDPTTFPGLSAVGHPCPQYSVAFPRLPAGGHPRDHLLMGGSSDSKHCLEGGIATAAAGEYECNGDGYECNGDRVFGFGMEVPIDLDQLCDFDVTPPQSPVVVADELSPIAAPQSSGGVASQFPSVAHVEQQHVYVDGGYVVDLMGGGDEASMPPSYVVGDDSCCTPESDGFVEMLGDFEMEELLTIVGSTADNDDKDGHMEGLSCPPIDDEIGDWLVASKW